VLADSFGRIATDLRVSVTDRCNLRCAYCMPAEGLDWLPGDEIGQGPRRGRALPESSRERGRAVRRCEVADPGAGPDPAGPFTSVKDLITAIGTFIDGWNERCEPFTWTKTADELLPNAHPVKELLSRDTSSGLGQCRGSNRCQQKLRQAGPLIGALLVRTWLHGPGRSVPSLDQGLVRAISHCPGISAGDNRDGSRSISARPPQLRVLRRHERGPRRQSRSASAGTATRRRSNRIDSRRIE
jgi:hypothetical protein